MSVYLPITRLPGFREGGAGRGGSPPLRPGAVCGRVCRKETRGLRGDLGSSRNSKEIQLLMSAFRTQVRGGAGRRGPPLPARRDTLCIAHGQFP